MDIQLIGKNSLKIKGRNASFLIDPDKTLGKTQADAIILLSLSTNQISSKIEGSRITITGPGEYEVGGVKVSATRVDDRLVISADVDAVKLLLGSGKSIEKIHDNIPECDIALVNATDDFNQAVLTAIEPKVLILFGENKKSVTKMLGKEDAPKASKYSATPGKLPAEMEIVLLG
ncbi:MAG: hypothetical protein HYW63_02625 [Candidatus Levybacteria bacterium]|nr:hypothetical protein [Candidatus Levybacteria bacterium]